MHNPLIPTIVLFFLFLLLPTRIRLTLRNTTLRIRFGFLCGLLPLLFTITLRRDETNKPTLRLYLYNRRLKPKRARPAPIHPLDVLSRLPLRLRAFSLDCTLGIRDDAALTALLCGLLHSTALTLLAPLSAREKHPPRLSLRIAPHYQADTFRIHCDILLTVSTPALLKALLYSLRLSKQKKRTTPAKGTVPKT